MQQYIYIYIFFFHAIPNSRVAAIPNSRAARTPISRFPLIYSPLIYYLYTHTHMDCCYPALGAGEYREYKRNRIYLISSNCWMLALYRIWEAGNSFKILSWDVRTFSTIEHFILRTSIFRFFWDPRTLTPKVRPARRRAGRTFSKSA